MDKPEDLAAIPPGDCTAPDCDCEPGWCRQRVPATFKAATPAQAVEEVGMAQALRDVIAERERQKAVEGWTNSHDDEHADNSLAHAAACYAAWDVMTFRTQQDHMDTSNGRGDTPFWSLVKYRVPKLWPDSWHGEFWKPKDRRCDLVRAAALLLAEIERIDRAALRADTKERL